MAQPLGIIHILVLRQATVHGLSQQVGKWLARMLRPRVCQVLLDKFAEAQPFVEFPDPNRASAGSDS